MLMSKKLIVYIKESFLLNVQSGYSNYNAKFYKMLFSNHVQFKKSELQSQAIPKVRFLISVFGTDRAD